MSRDMNQDAAPITGREQLIDYFRSGEKDTARRAFGTEHEKFVFKKDGLGLLSFEEPGGFSDLFGQIAERFGWEAAYDHGHVVALTRGDEAITLEPGGQFELSGGIKHTVFETAAEFDRHVAEIKEVAGDRLWFAPMGMNPFDDLDAVPWMPKSRYKIMRRYLPTRGDLAHWMMKMTCTVQGNYDYTSEADAADILRTSLKISPIVGALSSASPIRLGAPSGFQSFRNHIWTRTDPDRSGFPDFMYADSWGYEEYLEYVLSVPMFFIRRGGEYIDCAGLPFVDFMRDGYQGHAAIMGDFELHLSTVFPEVRMKKYIEVRGADASSREMMLALPALWKGILYDDAARAGARALLPELSPEEHRVGARLAHTHGLKAETPAGNYAELAARLVDIARQGLDAIAARHGHDSEAVFLEPYEQILATGRSHSDLMLEKWDEVGGDREAFVKAHAL